MSNSNWTKIPTSEEKREIKRKNLRVKDQYDEIAYESLSSAWYRCKARNDNYTTERNGIDAVNNYLYMTDIENLLGGL